LDRGSVVGVDEVGDRDALLPIAFGAFRVLILQDDEVPRTRVAASCIMS
jgi:hypothetical protein